MTKRLEGRVAIVNGGGSSGPGWGNGKCTAVQFAREGAKVVVVDINRAAAEETAALIAGLSDCCLFFIRWGTTSREQVVSALRRLALYNVKVSGTILSHVNLRRHAQFAAGEGYYRSYGRLPSFSR